MVISTLEPRKRVVAKYQIIKDNLVQRIKSGDLDGGEAVPSESAIRKEFGVSSTTARKCLDDLARQGYLHRIQGKGTYVSHLAEVCSKKSVAILCSGLVSVDHPVFSSLVAGLESNVDWESYIVEVIPQTLFAGSSNPQKALHKLIEQRNIQGIFILSPMSVEWIQHLVEQNFPVVCLNVVYDQLPVFSINCNISQITSETLSYLADLGHRRMAYIVGRYKNQIKGIRDLYSHVEEYINDFRKTEKGNLLEIEMLEYDWFDVKRTDSLIAGVLGRQQRPTAVVTVEESVGRLVWDIAYSMEIDVPADLSIMISHAGFISPHSRFTNFCQNLGNATWRAARIMEQLIQGEQPVRRHELIGGTMDIRESTAAAHNR